MSSRNMGTGHRHEKDADFRLRSARAGLLAMVRPKRPGIGARHANGVSMRANSARFAAIILFALAIAWRWIAAASLNKALARLSCPATCPIYTILCPVYREANVVPDLIAAIDRLASVASGSVFFPVAD